MEAVYAMKCIYTPLWKGVFFVLKDFDQSQELKTIAKKSLQFYMFPHRISLLFKLRPDFVIWKMVESKDEYMYRFMKFC